MEKAEFEKAVLSMVHNEGAERLTAANVAYKLGLSVKAAERQLDELVTEGGLELDSDDNGNLFYYVPGVSGGGVFSGVSGVNIDTSDAAGAHYPPKGHHPGGAKSAGSHPGSAPYGHDPRDPYAHASNGSPAPHGQNPSQPGNYGPGATPWGASYGPKPGPGSHHGPGSSYGKLGGYPPPPYAPQQPGYPPQQPHTPQHGYPPQQPYAPQHQQHPYPPQAPVLPSYAHSPAHSPYGPPQPGYGAPQPQSKGWHGYGSHAAPQHYGPPAGAQYHSPSGYGSRHRPNPYHPQYGHGTTAMVHQPPGHLRSPSTAAVLSSFPGAGQLYNGQVGKALAFFMLTMITYWVMFPLGILPHMWAAIDAKNTAKRLNYYGLLPP